MQQEIQSYLTAHPKTGPFPLAQEFNLTTNEARDLISEFNGLPKTKEAHKPRIATKKQPKDLHDFMTTHPLAIIFIRILAALIGLACLIRGFFLIVDFNGSTDPRAYLMPIIFQGLSFLFPILAWVEFQNRKVFLTLTLAFLSLCSMTYEFRVSLDGLLNASYSNVAPDTNKPTEAQINTLQTSLKQKQTQYSNLQTLLDKRNSEFSTLSRSDDGYYTTQNKINSLLKDQGDLELKIESISQKIADLQSKVVPMVHKPTIFSVLGIDENLTLGFIIVFQSLLIIFSAPLCLGVALLFNPRSIH